MRFATETTGTEDLKEETGLLRRQPNSERRTYPSTEERRLSAAETAEDRQRLSKSSATRVVCRAGPVDEKQFATCLLL